jgi:ribonuclease H
MMGIDEAGRGPTLGPMVYGSAFCRVEDEARLKAMGFADSKTLTEAKRESLWAELQSVGFIGWRIRVLHAQEISSAMLRRFKPYNLNAMSHDAAIGLVRQVLELGVNLRYLYVDTVGDPDVYRMKLESIFPNLQITVAKKADSIYPIVSVRRGWARLVSGYSRLLALLALPLPAANTPCAPCIGGLDLRQSASRHHPRRMEIQSRRHVQRLCVGVRVSRSASSQPILRLPGLEGYGRACAAPASVPSCTSARCLSRRQGDCPVDEGEHAPAFRLAERLPLLVGPCARSAAEESARPRSRRGPLAG